MAFNFIQTFYVDSDAVNKSAEILLTSVDLFFKEKPSQSKNSSGLVSPGVTISICDVTNDSPNPSSIYSKSYSTVPYSQVFAFSDASVPTTFRFLTPIPLKTNRFYGVVIKFDDDGYSLWTAKQGDRIINTNTPIAGTNGIKDGKLYQATNANLFKALSDSDLKFKVNIAKFTSNTAVVDIVNKDYEFFTINAVSGTFKGGEYVYQTVANATGNISYSSSNTLVVGDGTDFTALNPNSYIVTVSGTQEVLKVDLIVNSSVMYLESAPLTTNAAAKFMIAPVGKVYFVDSVKKKLFLTESSANSTVYFDASENIKGELSGANATIASIDSLSIDKFIPRFEVSTPAAGKLTVNYGISYSNGSEYILDANNLQTASIGVVNEVKKYLSSLQYRSNEVGMDYLYGNTHKSAITRITININNSGPIFSSPYINGDIVDFFIQQNQISNTYIQNDLDSEVFKNGIAETKHITKKVRFANNHYAEDIRVYMNAYKPANTEIRVYTKIHNSSDPETFDDKHWTPLQVIENADKVSSSESNTDIIEYTLGFAPYPESSNTLPGTFTTQLSNTVIVATGTTPNTYVEQNSLIKLYNPLIPENYLVAVVAASNTTTITLSRAVGNNNVVGSGFKVDTLKYPLTAFNNMQNDNVSRYYNTSLVEFDKFDSMQFKFVLLSDSSNITPEVKSIQCIGVSA